MLIAPRPRSTVLKHPNDARQLLEGRPGRCLYRHMCRVDETPRSHLSLSKQRQAMTLVRNSHEGDVESRLPTRLD